MNRLSIFTAAVVVAAVSLPTSFGSVIASDNTADPAYASGWANGSNGGAGFTPWNISNSQYAGYYLGDATNAGFASHGGGVNVAGHSWAIGATTYGDGGQYQGYATASRNFAALTTGETFSINIENGFLNSGGFVGLTLVNSASPNTDQFLVDFVGGNAQYSYADTNGGGTTGVGYTDGGLTVNFTVTGLVGSGYSYSATLTYLGQSTPAAPAITGTTNAPIDQFRLFDVASGQGSNYDYYANSVLITAADAPAVPEPASIGFIALASVSLLARRRRSN